MTVPELSLTEERIAGLAASGRTVSEIATVVLLDEPAVRWHLARATQKLEQAAHLHHRITQIRRSR